MAVDQDKLNAFLGKAVTDLGAAMSSVLISIGDELGFYKALAAGRLSSGELAAKTGTHERYVREWLGNQVAGGYVEFDAAAGKYFLSPEQSLCLADPSGPVDLPGAYLIVQDLHHVRERACRTFAPELAWNGVSITDACSMEQSASFVPAITHTLSMNGCQRCKE